MLRIGRIDVSGKSCNAHKTICFSACLAVNIVLRRRGRLMGPRTATVGCKIFSVAIGANV